MSGADPRWIAAADRLYAALLRLYPGRFREQWGAQMRQAFRDRCREIVRGERRPLGMVLELLPDLVAGAGQERLVQWGDMEMSKRNVMFALLLALGATVAFHDQLVRGALSAFEWWQGRHERAEARAWDAYRQDLVSALAGNERDPRSGTLLAWMQREPSRLEQAHWDRALRAPDPLALWLSVMDCPVASCDEALALVRLRALQPDNAAVALVEVEAALAAGDDRRIRNAFAALERTTYYRDHYAIGLVSLLRAAGAVAPPSRLLARHEAEAAPASAVAAELAAGHAMALVMPGYPALLEQCWPGTASDGPVGRDACVLAARTMADADSFIARSLGLRIWNRFAAGQPDEAEVRRRIRDYHWQFKQYGCCVFDGEDDGARWRDAWLAGGGEVTVLQRLMRENGVSLVAPPEFEPDARFFDPTR